MKKSILVSLITAIILSCGNNQSSEIKLIPVFIDKKVGYVDKKGKLIIPPRFLEGEYFNGEIALVQDTSKLYGYIDETGAWIIQPKYIYATSFTEEKASVVLQDSMPVIINKKGEIILRPKNVYLIGQYRNGFAQCIFNDDSCGFIDNNLKILKKFDGEVSDFEDELALVYLNKDKCFGFFSTKGQWTIKPIYKNASSFNNGYAIVKPNKTFGIINTQGEMILNPLFDDIKYWWNKKLISVKTNGKWGYIDRDGNIKIPPVYNDAGSFRNGIAAVKIDEQWGFIDEEGKIVITPQFTETRRIDNDIIYFNNNSNAGFIARDGKIIVSGLFDSLFSKSNNLVTSDYCDTNEILDAFFNKVLNPFLQKTEINLKEIASKYDKVNCGFLNFIDNSYINRFFFVTNILYLSGLKVHFKDKIVFGELAFQRNGLKFPIAGTQSSKQKGDTELDLFVQNDYAKADIIEFKLKINQYKDTKSKIRYGDSTIIERDNKLFSSLKEKLGSKFGSSIEKIEEDNYIKKKLYEFETPLFLIHLTKERFGINIIIKYK